MQEDLSGGRPSSAQEIEPVRKLLQRLLRSKQHNDVPAFLAHDLKVGKSFKLLWLEAFHLEAK